MRTKAVGPADAKVLVVGEAPGADEERSGIPFVGLSGKELTRMLHEAGFIREGIRITNVSHWRPPGNDIGLWISDRPKGACMTFAQGKWISREVSEGLEELAEELRGKDVVVCLGETALWAVTGRTGITKWRGSVVPLPPGGVAIPTYHPAAVLRQWDWRYIAVSDLRRARHYATHPGYRGTPWQAHVGLSYIDTIAALHHTLSDLEKAPCEIAFDIETRRGLIDCIGFAVNETGALCIPFEQRDETGQTSSYFSVGQEFEVVFALRKILTHPNLRLVGQNWLYDAQYIARHWGVFVPATFDTMIAHAVCFPGIPKSLDFISSLYLNDHCYWKDDRKEADRAVSDELRWSYNCEDCIRTLRSWNVLRDVIEMRGVSEPFAFEMELFPEVLTTMLRGVRADVKLRSEFAGQILEARAELERFFVDVLPDELKPQMKKGAAAWYDSPVQLQRILYQTMGLAPILHPKTKRPTVDDEALGKLALKEPLLEPIIRRLTQYRSLGVFHNTFISARLDADKRYRCSFNPVGTETFRFSSSADAFGCGTNLQNIPRPE